MIFHAVAARISRWKQPSSEGSARRSDTCERNGLDSPPWRRLKKIVVCLSLTGALIGLGANAGDFLLMTERVHDAGGLCALEVVRDVDLVHRLCLCPEREPAVPEREDTELDPLCLIAQYVGLMHPAVAEKEVEASRPIAASMFH